MKLVVGISRGNRMVETGVVGRCDQLQVVVTKIRQVSGHAQAGQRLDDNPSGSWDGKTNSCA
jgi:hypothetical protein